MTCLYSVVSVLTSVQICFQLRRSYTTSVYLDGCSVALEASKKGAFIVFDMVAELW